MNKTSAKLFAAITAILTVFLTATPLAFAQSTEKELIELAFGCDFPREIKGLQKIEICIIGRGPEDSISRDITIEDGLKISSKTIIGSGTTQISDTKKDGFDAIEFTPTNNSQLVTLEITGTYNDQTQKLIATFIVTQDLAKPANSTTDTPTETKSFPDVPDTHPNFNAITFLQSENIVQGYPDGNFRPDIGVNRAELLKIIIESLQINLDETKYQNCFPDVTDQWFAKYVCYAKEQNWVEGYPKKNEPKENWLFLPDITVNKVESLKMTLNAFDVPSSNQSDTTTFEDTDPDAWYYQFITTATDKKLIDTTTTKFQPDQPMNRGAISEIVYRILLL